ncbi:MULTISPECIES: cell division regulator GpsB [unclassified Streptococcus]|uniref:cell division regulator GpsB n=1 Tax=unclassified Streptococcus TaxID=2608887 RepID=UPI001072ABEB|nr:MULTISPECIES: cell division regulator GpsB [unclassified Streptococcus]MBF0787873.1 cell division regulator GpsB [Streptococcus sp. 19428wC2_LYSM12]MCQ9211157.1 cell division regulator GpsB [Streptococcus sp. B01]MCQ9214432.1 cell division regulator GpsB [Streptococcus sp. O1]TFV05123.1 cell division regulator GpsB [Streptococcus sp. LYSM12]
MASIKFTTKDIFEQDFKISFRGYDPDEVNDFLDEIMKDYDAYEAIIKELKGEIARLKAQMANAPRAAVASMEDTETLRTERVSSATNFDILRRLNRLEKEVFGKQIAQED